VGARIPSIGPWMTVALLPLAGVVAGANAPGRTVIHHVEEPHHFLTPMAPMTCALSQVSLEDVAVDAPACNGNRDVDPVLAFCSHEIPTRARGRRTP
jgi:hypothetical protein